MPVILRAAVSADAPALAALARETFVDTYGAFNTAQDMNLHLETRYTPARQLAEIENVNMLTIVAVDEGQLAGFAQGHFSIAPPCVATAPSAPRQPWEIYRFYLQSAWHGRGIAAQLMTRTKHAALAIAADAVWLSVWSRNARAQAFYRKSGFEHIGDTTFTLGRDVQHDFVMLWRAPTPTT